MAPQADSPQEHIVALNIPTWGHIKSACALLAKIVRQRPVYVTFFAGSFQLDKVNKELDFQFISGVEDKLRNLIKVVPLETDPNPFNFTLLNTSFFKEYKKLLESRTSHIPRDGVAPGPPGLILLDMFLYVVLQSIRAVSGRTIPVYALQSSSVSAFYTNFGPGGRMAELADKLKEESSANLETLIEKGEQLYTRVEGRVYKTPGIPSMYDHEQIPQKPLLQKGAVLLLDHVRKSAEECDGAVINTTALLEGESIKACQEWFGERPVICRGPFDYPIIQPPKATDPGTRDVENFLDSMLEKFGPNSAIYISLGSQFWPSEPDKLWTILDVLIEREIPFIFAHASRFAVVPDEIKEKIRASGIGYASNWLPQTTILGHEVCGWILTHAGQNSVAEALSAGVPMICWPFDADQPVNAANLTSVHNLGYELFEVRTGVGLGPIHRLGDWKPEGTLEAVRREFEEILVKMKGEDGALKRANAQKFRDAFAKLWAPGGENWQEIKRITDVLQ